MSQFDAKKIYDEYGNINMVEIEREARMMRALVLRDIFASLPNYFRITPTVISKEA